MSMNTYALEEKCAFVVGPDEAAAIVLADAHINDKGTLPQKLAQALDGNIPYWRAVKDPRFRPWLKENGFFSVSDAHDIVEQAGRGNLVHCSEFDGSATVPEDFPMSHAGAEPDWEDDFVFFLVPANSPSLFQAAYGSPQDLVKEYADAIGPFLGYGFDIASRIMDVSGTYFC